MEAEWCGPGKPRQSVLSPADKANFQSSAAISVGLIQDRALPTVYTEQTPANQKNKHIL